MSQQSLQTNNSAQNIKIAFKTYGEYEEALNAQAPRFDDSIEHDLWLGQMQAGSTDLRWYRFVFLDPKQTTTPPGFRKSGPGTDVYEHTSCEETFTKQLRVDGADVERQVILVSYSPGVSHPFSSSSDPAVSWSQIADIVGLGLDMTPDVWDHIRGREEELRTFPRSAVAWQEGGQVLDIGGCSLAEVAPSNGRPPTVIIFHARPDYCLGSPEDYISPVGRPCTSVLSTHPPSKTTLHSTTLSSSSGNPCQFDEHSEVWSLRQLVARSVTRFPQTVDGFRAACFETIAELHLSKPSQYLPFPQMDMWEEHFAIRKYFQKPYAGKGIGRLSAMDSRDMSMALRREIDAHRRHFSLMRRYSKIHLRFPEEVYRNRVFDLVDRFELYIQEMEPAHDYLNEYITNYSSRLSNDMARQSIQESKRVMLLTAFAFIFLPLSLASSIFGMNVQQINDSGHSIKAFFITAVVLCLTTFATWATSAAYMHRRRDLRTRWDTMMLHSWLDYCFVPERVAQKVTWASGR